MKSAHSRSIIASAAALALVMCAVLAQPLPAAPQQSGPSQDALSAAARRAREQQKTQPKAAKVWDNDNIPTNGGVDVIGPATASAGPPASAKAPAANGKERSAKEAAASSKKEKFDLEAQLKTAKENLKTAQTDLDFAQRKYRLDQQDYYQNPDYSSNTSGAAGLQADRTQIDAKKQAVQSAQDNIDDLEAKLAKASDSASSSNDNQAN